MGFGKTKMASVLNVFKTHSGSSHKKCVTVGMPGDSTSAIGTTMPSMLQWVLMTAVGGSMQQTMRDVECRDLVADCGQVGPRGGGSL